MRRILAALVPAVVGLATSAGMSSASGDDGPELTPPAVAEPAGELPKAIEARPKPDKDNGAVLIVPGITNPRARSRFQPGNRTTVTRVPWVDDGQPPLVGPSEMKEAATLPPPSATPTREADSPGPDGRPPLTLDSIPAGEDRSEVPASDPVRRRSLSGPRITPIPRRPGGLFGRFLSPGSLDRSRSGVTVEPRMDPAADAAIRKRIDRQIRENLGGALRSYEVRVVDHEVTVVARATRFWQKRAVRNALEALPALKGYKARVEVID